MEIQSSILEMARGAIMEQVDVETTNIINNILDPNTEAKKARKLTLTIEFLPSADRQTVQIKANAKSKLEPCNPISTALYVGETTDGVPMATELTPNIPGQTSFTGETENPKILKLAVGGNE